MKFFIIYWKLILHSHLHIEFNFAPFKHFNDWEQELPVVVVLTLVVTLVKVLEVFVVDIVELFEAVAVGIEMNKHTNTRLI